MGERISCSFQVGGKLTKVQAEELLERAKVYDEDIAIADIGEQWWFDDVNYGNLDELVDYCRAAGLDYEYWSDAGSEWDAHRDRYVGGEMVSFPCGHNGDYVTLDELTNLDALATGWAELHQRIKKWREPLPKAEIVG